MILVLEKVLSIFLLIAVGFVIGRIDILPKNALDSLNGVLLKVISPCLAISSITSKELTDETFTATMQILSTATAYCFVASLVGLFLSKFIFRIQSEDIGMYSFAFASINCGFLGFPVTLALFGQDIFYLMVMENVVTILYFFICGPFLLRIGGKSNSGEKNGINWREIVCNPNIVASVFSLIMLFCGLHLPDFLFESVDTLGSATIPLSMLVVGLQLSESKLVDIIKDHKLVIFAATKMLLLPVLTFLAVNWLPLAVPVKLCAVMASVFPVAVVVAPITSMEGKNGASASALVVITTIIAIATIPIFASFLTDFYLG